MKPRPWHLLLLAPTLAGSVDAADIASGGRIYGIYCVSCHGPSGQSLLPDDQQILDVVAYLRTLQR